MRHVRLLLGSCAVVALAAAGCAVDDETVIEIDVPSAQSQGEEAGSCYNGMSTVLREVDSSAPRCTLDDVPHFIDYVLTREPQLQWFLMELDGHATLQCHPYTAPDGSEAFCVDVVDRFGDGDPLEKGTSGPDTRNFFIAYAEDHYGSNEIAYWDAALTEPNFINAPVSLTVAGYVRETGEVVPPDAGRPLDDPAFRMLKFDPRNCPICGIYDGPNRRHIVYPAELQYWYPEFVATECAFQPKESALRVDYVNLDRADCEAETVYRSTGR